MVCRKIYLFKPPVAIPFLVNLAIDSYTIYHPRGIYHTIEEVHDVVRIFVVVMSEIHHLFDE